MKQVLCLLAVAPTADQRRTAALTHRLPPSILKRLLIPRPFNTAATANMRPLERRATALPRLGSRGKQLIKQRRPLATASLRRLTVNPLTHRLPTAIRHTEHSRIGMEPRRNPMATMQPRHRMARGQGALARSLRRSRVAHRIDGLTDEFL